MPKNRNFGECNRPAKISDAGRLNTPVSAANSGLPQFVCCSRGNTTKFVLNRSLCRCSSQGPITSARLVALECHIFPQCVRQKFEEGTAALPWRRKHSRISFSVPLGQGLFYLGKTYLLDHSAQTNTSCLPQTRRRSNQFDQQPKHALRRETLRDSLEPSFGRERSQTKDRRSSTQVFLTAASCIDAYQVACSTSRMGPPPFDKGGLKPPLKPP